MGDDTGGTSGMKRRRLAGDLRPLPAATEASFSTDTKWRRQWRLQLRKCLCSQPHREVVVPGSRRGALSSTAHPHQPDTGALIRDIPALVPGPWGQPDPLNPRGPGFPRQVLCGRALTSTPF